MEKDKDDSLSDEFMLSYFPTTYQHNFYERESSEKSFNAFLTLSSAIIGGMLVLVSNLGMSLTSYIIVVVALAIVLVFGYVVFERICSRSITSIRWMMRANLALSYFTEQDKKLGKYVKPHRINETTETWWESFRFRGGGLARLSAVVNIFPAIGIAVVITRFIFSLNNVTSAIISLFTGLLVWLIHATTWRKKVVKLQAVVVPELEGDNKKKAK